MFDINNLPELSAGGDTLVSYTRDKNGRVIAAHCENAPESLFVRRPGKSRLHTQLKRLESLFTFGAEVQA